MSQQTTIAPRTRGLRRAYALLAAESKLQESHLAAVSLARGYAGRKGLKLNCGCGPQVKAGWVNIDVQGGAELHLDLREDLPFDDGCAAIVYSEHFFEHLAYPDDALRFLREAYRVLEPGGVFSVGVPDTEWPLAAYTNDTDGYFATARRRWHPAWCNTRLHNINQHFRQGTEHKYAYDDETLRRVLAECGFVDIRRRDHDPNLDAPEWGSQDTLYMEARKPA